MNAPLSRAVAGLALAAGAAVLFAPQAPAIAGGLLLGFVLPGMALLGVLFRGRALTAVERAVLTPALSMGVLIVAGLVIHLAGLRIDRLAWTVATVGVTLAAVTTARLMRRRRPGAGARPARETGTRPAGETGARPARETGTRPAGETGARLAGETRARPLPAGDNAAALPVHGLAEAHTVVMSIVPAVLVEEDERGPTAREKARRRRLLRQFLPLVMVAGVLAGASWLSFDTSRAIHDTVVTALSATPPGPVDAAGNRTVRVSATGLLASDGPYTVSVTGPTGTATVKRTVAVTGDGTWSETLSLPGAQRMTVSLYRSWDTTAYRTLYVSAVD
ncbi:hypothetical protein [Actinoplanes sp. ATCC 53533]|uniref:hypothetical protein n=1 Tax=Actinoplanes sp. ATCC 53533 TaxID=1288362 RepID=UPI00131559E3|nr:hypothetical protein [Actinoplanes sp. ATCC 53533]